MPAQRHQGRFASAYDDRALPDAVRHVALHARPDAPATLTQAEFDRARAKVPGHTKAPTARQICSRLGVSWPDLLHALFDGGDVVRFLGRQQGTAADRDLTAEHIRHALRLIATRLGVRTLRPGQYEAARSDLLAAGARRYRHGQRISLPTAGQIERVAGNWDRALGLAGLQPRTRKTSTASPVSYQEAIRRFLISQGAMPTAVELEAFARAQGFPLPRRPRPHRELLQEVQAQFAAQGRWAPPSPPPKRLRPPYDFTGADVRRPGERRRPKRRSEEECINGIVAYLEQVSPSEKVTQKRYGAWAVGTGHPAPRAFATYGGWTALLAQARDRRRAGAES